MELTQSVALDATANIKYTPEGYLVAEPRVARIGKQEYLAAELGISDAKKVTIERPEKTVFDSASLKTYANKPVTLGHPTEPVTADNWREHAVGYTGNEVLRDGDFVRVPIMLTDKQVIEDVKAGRAKELSLGYEMALDWSKGEGYDAVATNIKANHLAVVGAARGGRKLSIGDKDMSDKLVTFAVDGLDVQATEQGAQVIKKYLKGQDAAVATLQAEVQNLKDELEEETKTKDAEIETLKKAVEDSKISPQKLNDMVAERESIMQVAKNVLQDSADIQGKTNDEIKKLIVDAKMGETSKDWDDNQVAAAYQTLKGLQGDQQPQQQNIKGVSDALMQGSVGDAKAKAYQGYLESITNGWQNQQEKRAN